MSVRMRGVGRRGLAGRQFVAFLVSFAVLATACGGDDDDESTGGSDDPAPSTTLGTGDGQEDAGLPPQPLAEPTTVKIGYSGPYEVYTTLGIADAMGEFERENIGIEWVQGPTADLFPQLGAGETDVQLSGLTPAALNAMEAGLKIRGVAPITESGSPDDGVWVNTELADGAPESLAGKTIGMQQGTGSIAMAALSDYLAEGGVELSDVTIEALNAGPDLVQAFTNGAIDAAWAVFPQTQEIADSGTGERVTDSSPGVLGVWFGPNLLDDDRDVGVAFVRALARTNRLYLQPGYKDDEAVVEALAEFTGTEAAAVAATPETTFSGDLAIDPGTIEDLQEIWIDYGDIVTLDEPLPTDEVIDDSLVSDALGG